MAKQQHKLLAPKATGQYALQLAQCQPDPLQHPIPHLMTMPIVDLLEVIQIEHHQRPLLCRASPGQTFHKTTAIE